MTLAQKIAPYYFGFFKFQPPYFPNVDVYAEKGSGLPTIVGMELPDLTIGQVLDGTTYWIWMDGDTNQEDITNDSVQVWEAMPCYHFEFIDNPGVDHLSLANADSCRVGTPADPLCSSPGQSARRSNDARGRNIERGTLLSVPLSMVGSVVPALNLPVL